MRAGEMGMSDRRGRRPRRGGRGVMSDATARSSSTTPPCATARSRPTCPTRSRTGCASCTSSTRSASRSSRAAGRARTRATRSSSSSPRRRPCSTQQLTAFGMTRKAGERAEDSQVLRDLLEAGTEVVCLVGKAWDLHVTEALRTDLDEGVAMVRDSVAFLQGAGPAGVLRRRALLRRVPLRSRVRDGGAGRRRGDRARSASSCATRTAGCSRSTSRRSSSRLTNRRA